MNIKNTAYWPPNYGLSVNGMNRVHWIPDGSRGQNPYLIATSGEMSPGPPNDRCQYEGAMLQYGIMGDFSCSPPEEVHWWCCPICDRDGEL